MPRGEHFKKENPRINQVSFKVSDSELVKLKELAEKDNLSIAMWLRGKILNPQTISLDIPSSPEVETVSEVKIEEKSVLKDVIQSEIKVINKAKNYNKKEGGNEQMSMF